MEEEGGQGHFGGDRKAGGQSGMLGGEILVVVFRPGPGLDRGNRVIERYEVSIVSNTISRFGSLSIEVTFFYNGFQVLGLCSEGRDLSIQGGNVGRRGGGVALSVEIVQAFELVGELK